jgi:hypothetical protein
MTRFRDALAEAAEQAPALGDIADRALAQSRRRQLRLGVPLAAVAVTATAAVVAGVLSWLPSTGSTTDVTAGPTTVRTGTVPFPDQARPLPAEGVGPVGLAYSMACDGRANASQCQWRVMTAEGEHYAVPDAAHPDGAEGLTDRGLVTVSPEGERLGYFRENGTFVLRDLASGEVEPAFAWQPGVLNKWPEVSWSPNGRWLAVSYADLVADQTWRGESVRVDTETMRTTELPEPEGLLSLRNNGDPLFESDVPERLLRSVDGALGSLSPDGNTLAAVTFPDWDAPTLLKVLDLDAQRVAAEYPIDRGRAWEQPRFLGWTDASTALILSVDSSKGSDAYAMNVDAFDTRTGKLDRLFHLPDSPRGVSLAAGLLGAS